MANIQKLKRRIKTAKNIAQTTKAMELVAASRMKKAQIQALDSRPYADRLLKVANGLFGRVPIREGSKLNEYFLESEPQGQTAIIFITPDKGLAGALVSNIGRKLLKFINDEGKKIEDYQFIVFGKKGRDLILRLGGNIIAQFDVSMTQPKFEMVPPVVRIFDEGFRTKKFNRVMMLYTHFVNTLSQEPKIVKLLPLSHLKEDTTLGEEKSTIIFQDYLFEPSSEEVLNFLLPHYFEIEVYHIMLEAYASEQSARMTAMKNATDNAMDIISELTLYYNKARQQVITSEISDIVTATMAV